MFRAYGSFPNGGTETSSLRNPLENIQTWGSSPIAPPPTPTPSPSTTSSSSPDFHNSQTQPNINNQRQNNIRHLQQSQFQNNLHAHQQQQQQQKSQPFYIEAMNNNNNNTNSGFKNNDIKGKKITVDETLFYQLISIFYRSWKSLFFHNLLSKRLISSHVIAFVWQQRWLDVNPCWVIRKK